MDNKAQGMSLKIVIIAAIALIILVVLVLIFTGKSKSFTEGTEKTSKQYSASDTCKIPGTGRTCAYSREDCEKRGGVYYEGPFEDCYQGGCCSA